MLEPAAAEARCAQLIDLARQAGADAADAVAIGNVSQSIAVRLGGLEDIERSESEAIGLRVFAGQRSASIHASDFSPAAMREMAERAVAMARAAPEDIYAGLAPEELLARGPLPELDLVDESEPSPQDLRAAAQAAEDAARAVSGVTNSEGGGAGYGCSTVALATSHGFSGTYRATSHSLSATVVAGTGAGKQRDYAWRQTRHAEDLLAPEAIGRLAGERAVARLDPGKLRSGPLPVVFDPRVAGSLLGHLIGAMSGPAIARRASFLLDRLEEELFDPAVRIVDQPHRRRGLRSRPVDGEGLPTSERALVEHGRLTGWLANVAAARQLGIVPTGHASRGVSGAPGVSTSNVHLEPGTLTREELIGGIADGVLVTELIGQGVNGVTGDYSRGASGYRIVKGEIAGPVAEFTIAGNLLDMFRRLTPASDLELHRAINAPTLLVEGMTVAGE